MNNKLRRKAATPREMAHIYGLAEGSLANMRYKKEGPQYFKVGRRVLYFFDEFERWLRRNPIVTKDQFFD